MRHEHEWKVWKTVKLPAGKKILPGVISHATNVVEHPELIADRLIQFADIVGKENVYGVERLRLCAKPVCAACSPNHHVGEASHAWREGARMATQHLWGRRAA